MNIFDFDKPKYKLPPKPKLFEAFAGIGCQRLAFDKLGLDYEMVGISEIDKSAIASYNAIHGDTKNYGDITKIKGSDLSAIDIFTYSFPCQDLSKAGKKRGMTKESRSGLVYDVLRILQELKQLNNLPKVLIMENVADLVSKKFAEPFGLIQEEIQELGYSNYTFKMNAKHYGVAQNRDRVFMVSILGDYSYETPKPFPLTKKLKDYLEENVDEKYYISETLLKNFSDMTNRNGFVRGEKFNPKKIEEDYASTIATRAGSRATDNYIKIPEKTKKGFVEAEDGDGVYINRPHQKRGVVQKQMIQTIKTSGIDVGVVDNMRIRKLTPRECWRLMGVEDQHFNKVKDFTSNTQLYKQAGNGIVIDVFAEIIKEMI